MKTLLIAIFLILAPVFAAQAQQDSRIQMTALDHLAAKASQTIDVNIDERLMRLAARVFDDKDEDEREVKKLVANLKGVYVKSFEFETAGQYAAADIEPIRTQLRGPGWTRLVNVTSKKDGILEVYLLFNGEQVGGMAVLHTDDKELTVVNIVGPVDVDKLARLEGQFGIPDLGLGSPKKTKNDDEK
ncbi:MAG TPA: DUF4252 domain-containing protein [Pyrinomonadaceae bacterium]|nr:DUF4252 domain-containing protein [Pyrinomonadaceae bacterium]